MSVYIASQATALVIISPVSISRDAVLPAWNRRALAQADRPASPLPCSDSGERVSGLDANPFPLKPWMKSNIMNVALDFLVPQLSASSEYYTRGRNYMPSSILLELFPAHCVARTIIITVTVKLCPTGTQVFPKVSLSIPPIKLINGSLS